jgi:hypothetical protein
MKLNGSYIIIPSLAKEDEIRDFIQECILREKHSWFCSGCKMINISLKKDGRTIHIYADIFVVNRIVAKSGLLGVKNKINALKNRLHDHLEKK